MDSTAAALPTPAALLAVAVTHHSNFLLIFGTKQINKAKKSKQNSPQGSTELVVVHVGFRLAFAPSTRHLIWIGEFELAVGALPGDAGGIRRIG